MKAILLAAGKGIRLRPYTENLPKCLMPIKGHPLLECWLWSLKVAGFTEVLINTHYLADCVEDYLKHNTLFPLGETCHISYEEKLLGTAGTLFKVKEYWQDQPVLVAHADNFFNFSLEGLVAAHYARNVEAHITMALFTPDNPENCGIVTLNERSVVTGFYEKQVSPPGNLANTAIYVMEPEVVKYLEGETFCRAGESYDISLHLIPELVEKIQGWPIDGELLDIGSVENWVSSQFMYLPKNVVFDTPWHQCYKNYAIHNQLRSLMRDRL